jgi:hypothetical protein
MFVTAAAKLSAVAPASAVAARDPVVAANASTGTVFKNSPMTAAVFSGVPPGSEISVLIKSGGSGTGVAVGTVSVTTGTAVAAGTAVAGTAVAGTAVAGGGGTGVFVEVGVTGVLVAVGVTGVGVAVHGIVPPVPVPPHWP